MTSQTRWQTIATATFSTLLFAAFTLGCGESVGAGSNPPTISLELTPEPPVELGETIRLDASNSSDPDGDTLTFDWAVDERPASSTASLSSLQGAIVQFTPDLAGEYTVELTVRDGTNSVRERRSLQVVEPVNDPPVADAGPDIAAAPGTEVTLDASASTDPDGDGLTYRWTLTDRPAGSQASLGNDDSAIVRFTVDSPGLYEAIVRVSDGRLEAEDTVIVRGNRPPVADAGPDRETEVDVAITLDGSASSDPDGDSLAFEWSLVSTPTGANVQIIDADQAQASITADTQGTLLVELQVSDGAVDTTDRMTVEVLPAGGTVSSILYLAPDGDDSQAGTQQEPLLTLGEGLRRAAADSDIARLQLAPGTYDQGSTEHVIERDLDIAGQASANRPVIKGTGDLLAIGQSAFVNLLRVELETNSTAVQVGDDAGLSLIESVCHSTRCVTTGKLFGEQGGRVTVRQSTLSSSGMAGAGIFALQADGLTVIDSTVENFGGSSAGIGLLDSSATIRNSIIRNNGRGIELLANSSEAAVLIQETQISGNMFGIRASNSKNVTVRDTTIRDSDESGILARGGAIRLENTAVESGIGDGIEIVDLASSPGAFVTLRHSTVQGNQGAGIRLAGPRASLDLGTDTISGNNDIRFNKEGQLLDSRIDNATGLVTISATRLAFHPPPAGTYSGPNFNNWGIEIVSNNDVIVY